MKKTILGLTALIAGLLSGSAAVTVQGWWHLGETADFYGDSSGNNRRFGQAYSTYPNANGNAAPTIINNGAAGPLGTTGYNSLICARFGLGIGGKRASCMWGIGYNPPASNYGIEIWLMPQRNGYVNGTTWVFSSGQSGGAVLRLTTDGNLVASYLGGADIGYPTPMDTNRWTHYAIVNESGTTTFYTNGIACGPSDVGGATTPAGDVHIGTPGVNQGYDGYLDEARMFTFTAGQFSTNDLLLRPPGPAIIASPENSTVWAGGAGPFIVVPSFDDSITYQWRRGGADIANGTEATLVVDPVGTGDSGASFECVLTSGGISTTTAVATLTVVDNNPDNVTAYRNTILAEPTLLAYFPADGDTGTTLSNKKDAAHNGTLEAGAFYDGRTNRAFGERAVSFNLDGQVRIEPNSAYEFPSGNGTIEAVVYMGARTPTDATILAVTADGMAPYYWLQVSKEGGSLVYSNDIAGTLNWPLPANVVGRLTHVALVFEGGVNLTAYVDGQNLGTKTQAGFGSATGGAAWIGAPGAGATDCLWAGAVDELSLYSSALSQTTVQTHYSRLLFGTNQAPPTIISQPSSKTMIAGGSPTLAVQAGGTLPLNYAWSFKGVPIPGATTASLKLTATTTDSSGDYVVTVSNPYGTAATEPITLTFVAPPSQYAAAVMNDHPVSYWRMGEGTGTTLVDSAGLFDGTYSGAFALGAPGGPYNEADTAANFTGGNARVGYTPFLNLATPFSVDLWVKANTDVGYHTMFSAQNRDAGRSGYALYHHVNDTTFEVHMGNATTVTMFLFGNKPVVAGTWYHVALVYDGTTARLYVDGVLGPDGAASGNYNPNNSKPLTFGQRTDGAWAGNDVLDEVAFYDYALSEAQIRKHVAMGYPTRVSITQVNNVVLDSKPAGILHHGLNNGATWAASNGDGTHTQTGVMQFAGATGNQITLVPDPDFNSPTGTICFWMRSAGTLTDTGHSGSIGDGAMLFDRRGASGLVIVQAETGNIFVQPSGGAGNQFMGALPVNDDLWHHITVTYDNAFNGMVRLYVDGNSDLFNFNAAEWPWQTTQQIELGRSHDTYWQRYNGYLDDVRIYNRILTDTEVADLASSGALVDNDALKVRFNFDAAPVPGISVNLDPSFGVLQSSGSVSSGFTDIPVALPYITIPSGNAQFFRGSY